MIRECYEAKFLLAVMCLLGAVAVGQSAHAQDGAAATGQYVIEEIIVTARKREEDVQDIPLSVSAVTSDTIERAGVENLEDVAALTAGLTFQSYNGGGLGSPTIRGLAQTDIASVDNNVGVFVDGVFISNKANLSLNLADIERVEVVKGPQSALYGNNTFGGAINYVTKRPTQETTGNISATAGTDELGEIAGSISGTLVDGLWTGRIGASYSSFDGTIDNTSSENLGGWDDKFSVTVQSEFTPSDNVVARFFYYHAEEEFDASAGLIVANNCGGEVGSPAGLTGRGLTTQRYFCGDLPEPSGVTVSPIAFGNDAETDLAYLNFEIDLGNVSLTSLTSYSDSSSSALSDQRLNVPDTIVAPEAARFSSPFFGTTETFSQELRLESFGDNALNWVVGAYYIDLESDRAFQVGTADDLASVLDLADLVTSEAFAVFGAVDYEFNDRWSGAVEVRYTDDSRDAALTGFGFTNEFSETFDFVTYRASLNFAIDDNSLLYASVARGAKSGGFNNTQVISEQSFDSEFNTTYEIGYKATLADQLTLGAAVYLSDWTDVQLVAPSSQPGNTNVTRNVGDVTSYGLEVDIRWSPTDNFDLSAGYSYSDPTFDSGTIDFTQGRRCLTPADCGLQAGPNGGVDISDQTVDRISEHQFYFSPEYSWTSGDWSYYARADLTYQSEQYQRSLNLQTIDARTLVNARIGMFTPSGLEISLWSKNLFDEDYVTSAINEPEFLFDTTVFALFQSTFSTAFVGQGQQFGLTVNYAFN